MTPEEQPLNTKEEIKKLENLKEKVKKKSLKEKLRLIKEAITVEPVLACYVIPGALARLATQNLNLDKACRVNKNYGDKVCDALLAREGNQYQAEELVVQELIASMETWRSVLLTVIPSILILFIGAWSDRTGRRKICIVFPIIGDLLTCVSNMLNVYFFYELPVEVTMFLDGIFGSIFGGWITTYMGIFSYISDASSEESRTFRVGIANLCLTAGGPIGAVLSGVLLNLVGYYGVFAISSLLYLFCILYGIYVIKDPKKKKADDTKKKSTNVCSFLKTFFDMKHVKDTLIVAFKKGHNHRRTRSILVFLSILFIYGPSYGEFTVRYLFTRYRFNWDALKYSFYTTFYILIHSLDENKKQQIRYEVSEKETIKLRALISISLFSRRLKWDDSVLGLISIISKIIGALATGFARNSMEMYIAVAVEMFNATSFTALRSISSKMCTSDELGKMTSVFNLMEVITSMIFGPIYSWVYMYTLPYDAGVIYYVSTVLTVPVLGFFGWFFYQHRIHRKDNEEKNDEKIVESELKTRKDSLFSSIDLVDEKIL